MALKKKSQVGKPVGPWISARKTIQYLSLVLFLALFIFARRENAPAAIINLPMRLDPLAMLAHLLADRTFLAGSALALATILLTLILGRAWCGWLCPLGTVLDLAPLHRLRKRPSERPESWRKTKYLLLLSTIIAAFFGNLTLLIFDPLTILFRTLTISIWPALDQVVTVLEANLYQIPVLAEPISSLDMWIRPAILPFEPIAYGQTFLFVTVFLAVITLNYLAPRFWCRYLCPLGGLLGIIGKVAILQRKPGEGCGGCTICTQVCPTGTIDPGRGFASDPAECTMCLDCLEACPRSSITFQTFLQSPEWNTYDPHRREALASIGATVAAVVLFRTQSTVQKEDPFLIRPPGVHNEAFLSRCVRCAECVRVCPTGALQPALFEAGLEGLWAPMVVPRMGYCDYGCHACGEICPVQAIPALELAVKRTKIIGLANIDRDRCLAWADETPCIVCEEMCPLPEKAIYLENAQVRDKGGESVMVQQPHVLPELCIGCGICEFKCPVEGEAAIRVYNPAALVEI